jgi:hypothetical protein
MLRFLAIHPAAFTEEQLQPLSKETLPAGVTWKSTFTAFDEGKTFCHWLAPSKDDLLAIFTKYEVPCETLHEVRLFDPATGTMEAAPVKEEALTPV